MGKRMLEFVFELLEGWTASYWQEGIALLGLVAFLIGLLMGSYMLIGGGLVAMVVGGVLLRRKLANRA